MDSISKAPFGSPRKSARENQNYMLCLEVMENEKKIRGEYENIDIIVVPTCINLDEFHFP